MADRSGTIALLAGVGMIALVALSALGLDLGAAYAQKVKLQKVADSAAMAGAIAWTKNPTASVVQATVTDVVVANGWPASIIQTTAAPTPATPNVTVSLVAPSAIPFASVFMSKSTVNTTGYSVASVVSGNAPACLLALTTLMVNGNLNINGCAAVSNLLLTVNSGATLIASVINTTLLSLVINGTVSPTPKTGVPATVDPYSGSSLAALAGFLTGCSFYTNQTTLTPGCYYNANIGVALTLSPGVYFFPTLNINSGGSITGTGGVTIVTGSVGTFNAGGNITITAPTYAQNPTFAGIAIDALGGLNMNSGVTFKVNGAIYSALGTVILNSGTWNQSACTYIVALAIISNSGSTLTMPQSNCGTYGYPAPSTTALSKVALLQ